ncbi:hypothetical protein PR048_012729 [Dryococelus australis]|uniref:Uncharacterized protein n=1 Tax=Dryococelus australis TaxID=614101 RepID=A0ABQ9HQ72_9NEOP|nr:hypothetical protein PR048_012729 [Dryococelus australis]
MGHLEVTAYEVVVFELTRGCDTQRGKATVFESARKSLEPRGLFLVRSQALACEKISNGYTHIGHVVVTFGQWRVPQDDPLSSSVFIRPLLHSRLIRSYLFWLAAIVHINKQFSNISSKLYRLAVRSSRRLVKFVPVVRANISHRRRAHTFKVRAPSACTGGIAGTPFRPLLLPRPRHTLATHPSRRREKYVPVILAINSHRRCAHAPEVRAPSACTGGTAGTPSPPLLIPRSRHTALNLKADEDEASSAGMQGRGKSGIPEESRQPVASSGTIPTCENMGATSPRMESVSPSWEMGNLTTASSCLSGKGINTVAGYDSRLIFIAVNEMLSSSRYLSSIPREKSSFTSLFTFSFGDMIVNMAVLEWSGAIWVALNIGILRTDEGVERRNEWAGKQEIPEKTRRPMASSGTIPTCENPEYSGRGLNPDRLGGRRAGLPLNHSGPGVSTMSFKTGFKHLVKDINGLKYVLFTSALSASKINNRERNGYAWISDESRFDINADDGCSRLLCHVGKCNDEALTRECDTYWTPGVMVWIDISYNTRSHLVVDEGTQTAQSYVSEVLRPNFLPHLRRIPNAIIQQGNAIPIQLTALHMKQQRGATPECAPHEEEMNDIQTRMQTNRSPAGSEHTPDRLSRASLNQTSSAAGGTAGAGSASLVSISKPNSTTSSTMTASVVVNLPASYPGSEVEPASSASTAASPATSPDAHTEVRISTLFDSWARHLIFLVMPGSIPGQGNFGYVSNHIFCTVDCGGEGECIRSYLGNHTWCLVDVTPLTDKLQLMLMSGAGRLMSSSIMEDQPSQLKGESSPSLMNDGIAVMLERRGEQLSGLNADATDMHPRAPGSDGNSPGIHAALVLHQQLRLHHSLLMADKQQLARLNAAPRSEELRGLIACAADIHLVLQEVTEALLALHAALVLKQKLGLHRSLLIARWWIFIVCGGGQGGIHKSIDLTDCKIIFNLLRLLSSPLHLLEHSSETPLLPASRCSGYTALNRLDRIAQNAAEEKPYDQLGKFVAAELRQLPQRKAILLQKEIQNCIIRSKLSSLENVCHHITLKIDMGVVLVGWSEQLRSLNAGTENIHPRAPGSDGNSPGIHAALVPH